MTYRVHGLEHGITVDIHIHGSSALDTAKHHAISRICEAQIFLLEHD